MRLAAGLVAGQAPVPVSSGQDRIELVSLAGVAAAAGELGEPLQAAVCLVS